MLPLVAFVPWAGAPSRSRSDNNVRAAGHFILSTEKRKCLRNHWLERQAMPANLTHQYRKAEEDYRRATTPEEELRCLQVMLRELPKHKGTDKLQDNLNRFVFVKNFPRGQIVVKRFAFNKFHHKIV